MDFFNTHGGVAVEKVHHQNVVPPAAAKFFFCLFG